MKYLISIAMTSYTTVGALTLSSVVTVFIVAIVTSIALALLHRYAKHHSAAI